MPDGSSKEQQIIAVVSEQAELRSLVRWLESGSDVRVEQVSGTPAVGEQGALDVLTVLAGSGGLIAAIKILPEFIRSRRSGFSVTLTVKGQPFTLDATNVEEILPILERLLDDA